MTVFVRLTGEAIALQALDSDAVRRLLAGLSRTQWAPSLNQPVWFKNDATADEVHEEIMGRLTEAGVLDLTALPALTRGIAN